MERRARRAPVRFRYAVHRMQIVSPRSPKSSTTVSTLICDDLSPLSCCSEPKVCRETMHLLPRVPSPARACVSSGAAPLQSTLLPSRTRRACSPHTTPTTLPSPRGYPGARPPHATPDASSPLLIPSHRRQRVASPRGQLSPPHPVNWAMLEAGERYPRGGELSAASWRRERRQQRRRRGRRAAWRPCRPRRPWRRPSRRSPRPW